MSIRSVRLYGVGASILLLMSIEVGSRVHPSPGIESQWPTVERTETLPLLFEENIGQAEQDVRFFARGSGYGVFLNSTALTFQAPDALPVRLKFVGAHENTTARGVLPDPLRIHYFFGNNQQNWRPGVPVFQRVELPEVLNGTTLALSGSQRRLQLEFSFRLGAVPEAVRLEVVGAEDLSVSETNDILIQSPDGLIRLLKPSARQGSTQIQASLVLAGGQLTLRVPDVDPLMALNVRIQVVYESARRAIVCVNCSGIAVDSDGAVFVTGAARFPKILHGGKDESYVAKLTHGGTRLEFLAFFGGSENDVAHSIVVDSHHRVFVAGATASQDFPLARPVQASFAGVVDAMVFALAPDGSSVFFSSFFGGKEEERARSISVDRRGDIHLAGGTSSPDLPVVRGTQQAYGGGRSDAFVAKIAPQGAALIYSTYLGGANEDFAAGVAAGEDGSSYVSGWTQSYDFPVRAALQPSIGSGICGPLPCHDAFVARVAPSGRDLVYSSYLGGGRNDYGGGIAVDKAGNIYVGGNTHSLDFPTFDPVQPALAGGNNDGFVAKLSPEGSALLFSTYLGGNNQDYVARIAVDSHGRVFAIGLTDSADFPVFRAPQAEYGGGRCGYHRCADGFLTVLDSSRRSVKFSSYLGGNESDLGVTVAVGQDGSAYALAESLTARYPLINPLQAAHANYPFNLWLLRLAPWTH